MIASSVHYLLRRHAVVGQLQRAVQNDYDPATSDVTQDFDRFTVRLVFVDDVWTRVKNSVIGQRAQRILMTAQDAGTEPAIADRICYKDKIYDVQGVSTVRDGEEILAYVCEVANDG